MSMHEWQVVVDCRGMTADQRELLAAELWDHPITGIEERTDDLVVGFVSEADVRVRGPLVGHAVVGHRGGGRQLSRRVATVRRGHRPSAACSYARRGSRANGPTVRSRSSSNRDGRSAAVRTRRPGSHWR